MISFYIFFLLCFKLNFLFKNFKLNLMVYSALKKFYCLKKPFDLELILALQENWKNNPLLPLVLTICYNQGVFINTSKSTLVQLSQPNYRPCSNLTCFPLMSFLKIFKLRHLIYLLDFIIFFNL